MRIKHIECDQFAGLLNKELDFDKGLNVIVGENESGKSTIVDLIYYLLFKDTKLDGRSDSEFIDRYFPKNVSGPQGDIVDGVISFETENGTYKLKKEWENGEGTCRLTLPNGTSIKGKEEIKKVLQSELEYRAGVYSEIVFASQKRDQKAIESIMKTLGKKKDNPLLSTRSDLTSTLTQAALETGGVTIEKIEKEIEEKKQTLIDNWVWNADAPKDAAERGTYKNPWKQKVGEILKAYYSVDELRSRQADAEKAERAVEEEKARKKKLAEEKKADENERSEFQKYSDTLGQLSLLSESIDSIGREITEKDKVLDNWPQISSNLAIARQLKNKQEQAHFHDLYSIAEPANELYLGKKAELERHKEVYASDLKKLTELTRNKQDEERKFAGLNLVAKIKKLGSDDINVASIATGKAIDLLEGEVQITEAVDINIPGIMDMQLIPKGVDVDAVKQNLLSLDTEIKALYEAYSVNSLEELQDSSDAYLRAKLDTEEAKLKLEKLLGEISWEELSKANETVPADIATEEEVNKQIADLCEGQNIEAYIGGLQTTLLDYQNRYESVEKLKESIEGLKNEKSEKKKKIDSMDEVPEKYRGIEDPDQYDDDLRKKIESYEEQIRECDRELEEEIRQLGEKSAEEYTDELQDKESEFKALKDEYAHWLNIESTFRRLKDQLSGNPAKDIEVKFREYLEIITDGSLRLDSMDEKMTVQLASGTHALSYDILSEGTKDTISLAFRLAMLDHLYPEGNGLAVFDDPFTDMDPKRVEQACKLIQKYAEKNQVIFVTCDDKYNKYLEGNWISI